ncbi:carbon storage regulator CsrA [Microbulbifer spongiae]|uniref:Translational regulator CsrA n=1 Tax=Microbulbifer spongiae TaxID=2944933 RepID=A0ABY9E897_9GAMM|nr:carbon storage regulator CsrA [Microbulbifer sp. MI-G]WKD48166.1 carbon storage regulator CsrA [Microbulbifer sp. MI-G]
MLILKRRPGENLRIGKNVSVIVLEITGNQVRVGIKAPKSLPVHREEVYLRIQKERARDNGKPLPVASPRGEGLP